MNRTNLFKTRKVFFKKFFFVFLFLFSLNSQAKAMFLVENLIKSFLSPNALLLVNAMKNSTQGIQKAIKIGASVDTQNEYLQTALHLATWHKNLEAINILIENDINIRTREESGHTALHVAVSKNSAIITQRLILESKSDPRYINEENDIGNTPLHLAALENSHRSAIVLIEANANINYKNKRGKTPLHIAVIQKYTKIIKILICAGADTRIRDNKNKSPLSYADRNIKKFIKKITIQRNKEKLEKRLADLEIQRLKKERLLRIKEKEIRIYNQNITTVQSKLRNHLQQKRFNKQRTAIVSIQSHLRKAIAQCNYKKLKHISRIKNDLECKERKTRKMFLPIFDKFLLNINGPVTKLPTKKELLKEFKEILFMQSISMRSISMRNISTEEISEEKISFRHLVRNFKDTNGNTALHLFAMYGKQRFITALLLNGTNINVLNNNKETPLHLAIEANHIQAAITLIYLGANPNAQSSFFIENPEKGYYTLSQTPLSLAVEHGCKEIFSTLIRLKNINLDIQTKPFNQTALHLAVATENKPLTKELLKAGANTEPRTIASNKFTNGATAQEVALDKIEHAPELYACFDSKFAERTRAATNPSLIFNLNTYRNVDQEIEEKINNFIEWLQENQNIDFSSIQDKNKNNIFHYLAKYNHPQLTRLTNIFLELGINLNARNRKGFTPLQVAVIYGNVKMAQAFVNFGAKISSFI